MAESSEPSCSNNNACVDDGKLPTCVIVLGMAGSGKTTFVQRMASHLFSIDDKPYLVNLDPAVHEVPYPANIDICDTVKYKEVMKQHKLGPNGAIMTSLNLFATRFDQVMQLLDKRKNEIKHVVIDTPGQIEVFTWSASGMIITETLASTYPTVVVYVMDSARCQSPVTFMSNMVYACSILYRTKLPFVVVMNKCDIVRSTNLMNWVQNFESFQEALQEETTYVSDLTRSLSLVLEEFYSVLECVEFSALTGFGCDQFVTAIGKARQQYYKNYKPEYERLKLAKEDAVLDEQRKQLQKFAIDRKSEGAGAMAAMHTGTEQLTGTRIHLGNLDEQGRIVDAAESQQTETLDSDDDPEEDKEEFRKFLETVRNPKAK